MFAVYSNLDLIFVLLLLLPFSLFSLDHHLILLLLLANRFLKINIRYEQS